MSTFQTHFTTALRTARKSATLTQHEIADRLGINRSTYTYYELGKAKPDLETLSKLCVILSVSADQLLGLA